MFFSPVSDKEMEKKMLHSGKSVICMGSYGFVPYLMRSWEQNPCPTKTLSLPTATGGKKTKNKQQQNQKSESKKTKSKGQKTGDSKTQKNWEQMIAWTFCFCSLKCLGWISR